MRAAIVCVVIFTAGLCESVAQSHSFRALEDKFSACENVHSFETSGFLARTVLWFAGEHEFKKAIKHIKNIRLIIIPRSAFKEQSLSVRGFKNVVRNDSFEELAFVREHDEEVVIYLQPIKNLPMNRYLILIENPEEVVAVEIKGYIDADLLRQNDAFAHKL